MFRWLRDFIALNAGVEPVGLYGAGWRASLPTAAMFALALRSSQLERASTIDSSR